MKIEDIIYETTRGLLNLEDKLRIGTIFLFCKEQGSERLSQLLYAKDHSQFIDDLNREYEQFGVDFTINFQNENIKSAFYETLEKVKGKWDANGFLKAIAEGDEYALAICKVINYPFNKLTQNIKK